MSGPNPGAPDWQNGVFNPELVLAHIAAPGNSATVAPPLNTDALWISSDILNWVAAQTVTGVTTGINYPSYWVGNGYAAPILTSVDATYTVSQPGATSHDWWITSEAWGSIVLALLPAQMPSVSATVQKGQGPLLVGGQNNNTATAMYTDLQGKLYTVAGAPSTDFTDHPPTELQFAGFNGGWTTSLTTIVAAPGSGKRIRLFHCKIWQYDGNQNGLALLAVIGGSNKFICFTGYSPGTTIPPYTDETSFPLTGIPCDANTAVSLQSITAGSSGTGFVIYTIETI